MFVCKTTRQQVYHAEHLINLYHVQDMNWISRSHWQCMISSKNVINAHFFGYVKSLLTKNITFTAIIDGENREFGFFTESCVNESCT